MVEKTLSDLFLAQLKDIYYAEKKIFRHAPKDGEGGPGARSSSRPLRRTAKRHRARSSVLNRCSK